jgi:hypothetical protein
MSSTFTTGEKRKKVITYGKSSRLTIPPPLPTDNEDAPFPERPRKYPAISNEPVVESGEPTTAVKNPGNARAATTSPDVFDVPSEDEFESHLTKPAKRSAVQRSKTDRGSRINPTKKDAFVSTRPVATASRSSHKPSVPKSAETTARRLQEQAKPQQLARAQFAPSKALPAARNLQSNVLQSTEGSKRPTTGGQRLQRSNTSSKNVSRATTPAPSIQPVQKPQSVSRNIFVASTTKTRKPTIKQAVDMNVFDVPSSDEDASLPIPEAPRQTSRQVSKGTAKELATSKMSSLNVPQKVTVKSNELGALQNRKRKGSMSSITAPKPVAERTTQELSIAQRERKYPKKEKGTSPGHESTKTLIPHSDPHVATVVGTINKPRKTRTRTVPVLSQPIISKGQSSPAVLHKMIPADQAPERNPETTTNDILASDDTMYDIPDPLTTPVRKTPVRRTATSTPGSVTPRQKDLFSTLLGGSAAPKTPASALASLQLTEKKPRSLLGALARSKSDLTCSSQSRKTRLIHSLKDEDTSSEDDESGSDEEADSTIVAEYGGEKSRQHLQVDPTVSERAFDDVDMDDTAAADSQTSQLTSGAGTRPRLTYAAQRSYLQEANPEDEFLMSMDLDDNWKVDSQTVSTDDEDGPTSQVRTHHELKKYGQNTMFSWDMEESIRDISDGSSNSIRRSAMMELCTKMADVGFVSQLLDSGFTHKLLENIKSTGDIVFDFVAAASVLFILHTKPAFAVVDQIHRSGVTTTLIKMMDNDVDILRIARDRKSNMSKIAQDTLADFRTIMLKCKVWTPSVPEKVSPQLVALKALDLLTLSLRESGSTEALLNPTAVSKLTNICLNPSNRIKAAEAFSQDSLVLDLAFSVLETVSIVDQDYATWPTRILQHLIEVMPVFFEPHGPSKTVEAMKLCMNLTNNKPKACRPFSTQEFVQPLVQYIIGRFGLLHAGGLDLDRRTEVLATLTLSLGAMINLAELDDQARLNTNDEKDSIEKLVKTFLVGSERAAQVCNPL